MSRSRAVLAGAVAAVAAALAATLAGCGRPEVGAGPQDPAPDGRLVLVSGRDDHGELAAPEVPVHAAPGSAREVAAVPDGTLAEVTRIEGSWLHVVTAEGPRVRGWVDDFHLRGVLHLVGPAPDCRERLAGTPAAAGLQVVALRLDARGGRVLVATPDRTRRGWVPRASVRELPPRGPGCGVPSHEHGRASPRLLTP